MSSSSKKFSKLSFWSTSVPVRFQGWSTRVTSWDINCLRHICQIFYIGSTNSGDGEFQKESRKPIRFSVDLLPKPGCWESCLLFAHFIGFFSKINKSQCQLYKRLAEPIIPLFFGLVWSRKGVSTIDVITRGQSTAMFLCIGPFSAWWQPTKEPGDPRSSLLLTSEKSVFCNFYSQTVDFCQ